MRRTVEVAVPYVEVVHAFSCETGRDLGPIFLKVEYDGQKTLDARGGHVVPIGPLDERLALEVEDGDK